jgi:FlaA1/EpsC-like NDP-sugar epimerase
MVTVSTDKAVEPVSIMGATKRVAEHLMRAAPPSTRMHAVRLGNVWRSTGSLVPLLERQIAEQRPLTITDPACTRSFLPVEVAVERILYALVLGRGRPANFACAVEESRSVADVVDEVVRGAGLDPGQVSRRVIGLRPGERRTERMTGPGERISPEPEGGLHEILGGPVPSRAELANALGEIETAVTSRDLRRLLAALLRLVPDYAPSASLLERRTALPAGVA